MYQAFLFILDNNKSILISSNLEIVNLFFPILFTDVVFYNFNMMLYYT